eukprot:1196127-Prorocentrum_minimum.AAC.8
MVGRPPGPLRSVAITALSVGHGQRRCKFEVVLISVSGLIYPSEFPPHCPPSQHPTLKSNQCLPSLGQSVVRSMGWWECASVASDDSPSDDATTIQSLSTAFR